MAAKKMNPTIKMQWLLALKGRHSPYKQGHYYLNKDGCMCVLGVLCDLYRRAHPGSEDLWKEFGDGKKAFLVDDAIHMPPAFVFEWAGINYDPSKASSTHPVVVLYMQNDGLSGLHRKNFVQLAEYIDAYF